ncbi:MAG: hypothetical protein ACFB4I_12950 [Cyanophyceae cyanobacterium]
MQTFHLWSLSLRKSLGKTDKLIVPKIWLNLTREMIFFEEWEQGAVK